MNIVTSQNMNSTMMRPLAYKNQVTFRSTKSLLPSVTKKTHSNLEYSFRVIANKFSDLIESRGSKQLTQTIAKLTPQRNRVYLEQLAEIGRIYASKKVIDANIEDNILEQLAQKGDSVIFILSHSNQSEDPQMLGVLNTLLAEAYKKQGCETFPLPKIIMNEDILKTMNPTKRKAFENFGAVGIDAAINGGDKGVNARALLPLIKDFVRQKSNIFIFPEGRLAVRKDLDLYQRFQPGVASLINKILGLKKEVTVVPVGFAYGKDENKNLAAMNIGTPLVVKRNGNETSITRGDVSKAPDSVLYNFFEKHPEEDVIITSKGEAVAPNDVTKYLKTILSENLGINIELANKKLETPLETTPIQEI